MNRRLIFTVFVVTSAVWGCEPAPVQYPPGSAQYPSSASPGTGATPQSAQVTGSQRWQHAWSKAMEGVAMGGSIGGPYGAGAI